MTELYIKHRPSSFKTIIGQSEAVKTLEGLLLNGGLPHSILLCGPSGVGKTTIARILKKKLKCSDADFYEINAADTRGIDTVRDIARQMMLAPMNGKSRIWLLDEAHQLSRRAGGDAQTALLKMLEDTPSHVYFILATTDPQQLLPTILTRCTQIKLRALSPEEIEKLAIGVLQEEYGRERKLGEEVLHRIAEMSEGSARKALVILNQIINLETEQEQVDAILSNDVKKQAIDIARALINPKSKWPDVANIIKAVEEEPEKIRRLILGYASAVLLNGANVGRAYQLIVACESHWFDSGKAGLVRAAWEVLQDK